MMLRNLTMLSAATGRNVTGSLIQHGCATTASTASTARRWASTSSAGRSKDEASAPAGQAHDTRIDEVDHMRTSRLGRALLTAGSALGLLNNPARGDLLSMLTQVSSGPSLSHLLGLMRSTESGRRLLIERPSVNSETVDVEYLCSLERGKFGREWMEWLKENGVGPDGRAEADYMPTPELKYLIQRYRESHDFYHLLLRMPVTQLGETVVKYFEMAQMNMPVAGFAAAGGTLRILASNLSSLPKPSQLLTAALSPSSVSNATASAANPTSGDLAALQSLIPWAIEVGKTSVPLISVEWEKCWERDIDDMRREFGITRPPIAVARFAGRTARAGKRRGWPSKIVEHQKRKEQAQQQQKQSSSQSPSSVPAAHSESR
ncbi:ubiquinone biosynthesis protein COQ4, mitochondrial [Moesziomyces antarcticus]|uniref:Related to COQ4 - responsible for restoring ubiquinone biosynthesis in coq4 mutant n=2 Tax=Pseudozyma antarctica TaxID=84753 RepID=A0A5C3FV39_PSEA2|nr:ubiquinone biosynthesis protein COQ4, mitochondrial [Moesziomyces antarcticus]GAK66576.1 ubiquinone biosynthesis protein COQ4, mitochondrial [Moesziomyces antarcticus]SPO47625.1 related to COQ4 - responsible for restoring ubiquinone biosynthesis in coq4 mutant [Moesziomyces antarcticus]